MRRLFREFRGWRAAIAYSANYHFEAFFVSAIATVLVIRIILKFTDYPQLGGGGLHIAHVLWGGILMLVSLVIQMTFMGDRPRSAGALLGGVGFGFFIDEMGKYLTNNNNYFFKPAALVIYGLFLLLWLSFQYLDKKRSTSRKARAANILFLLEEGLLYGFNKHEREVLVYELLQLEESGDKLAKDLKNLYHLIEKSAATDQPSYYMRLAGWLNNLYSKAIRFKGFVLLLFIVFALQGILSLVSLVDFFRDLSTGRALLDISDELSRAEFGQLAGWAVYSVLILAGFIKFRESRVKAYRIFKNALLINIFVTQFFAFYRLQFAAVSGLFLNLALLGAVNYLIRLEAHHKEPASLIGKV